MASNRRLQKEVVELKALPESICKIIEINEQNFLNWTLLLLPQKDPYSKGAFRIQVTFPAEYPFKPPKIVFNTQIYHPNVDEKGQVCLGIVLPENWKPATKIVQVVHELLDLICEPELDHPLRSELAEEFRQDKKKFFKTAEDFTKKHAEKRD
ncbi:unnamed protein product [Bursaphelenchus okinawaensis]|uniref:E2 ubiquitin-conjugating enzyme n=1 Tax=Bursaphelenchus okinawaensis TaxID=465554 RepID=A0A811KD55_9BILA|nr:unnamed protein product [Bursaphelenchus okinawaensis]CAG9101446.1 unnamed protein product [Bursaphelenchus okinawaensis]